MRLGTSLSITQPRIVGGLWTPDELGADLALWLDAEDTASITLNGSNVSQWNDKSGNNRHVSQGVAASQPAYSATGFNNKPTIQHDGVNDFLLADTTAQAIGSQAFTLLGAIRFPTSISIGSYIISLRETSGQSMTRGYLYRTSNTFLSAWGDPFAAAPSIPVVDGTNNILGVQRRTGGVAENFVNGVAGGSITATFPSPFGRMSLGALLQGEFTDSWFSEVVISTGTMTTTDRQKLEGYLAWKWALEANLPVDHPYKTTPPTV
jgi:hypothetical protein